MATDGSPRAPLSIATGTHKYYLPRTLTPFGGPRGLVAYDGPLWARAHHAVCSGIYAPSMQTAAHTPAPKPTDCAGGAAAPRDACRQRRMPAAWRGAHSHPLAPLAPTLLGAREISLSSLTLLILSLHQCADARGALQTAHQCKGSSSTCPPIMCVCGGYHKIPSITT